MENKICSKCKEEKLITDFAIRSKEKNTFANKCKQCHNNYNKQWYRDNEKPHKVKTYAAKAKRKLQMAQAIFDMKKITPCKDCEVILHPFFMDYDHLDPSDKIECISGMISAMYPFETIINEVKKCELLCVMCHRKRTLARLKQDGKYPYDR